MASGASSLGGVVEGRDRRGVLVRGRGRQEGRACRGVVGDMGGGASACGDTVDGALVRGRGRREGPVGVWPEACPAGGALGPRPAVGGGAGGAVEASGARGVRESRCAARARPGSSSAGLR